MRFNSARGASIQYGVGAIKHFLKSSRLQFLVRSHTCVPDGFQLMHGGHTMTLFSVPGYNEGNLGAYAVLYGLFDDDKQPNDAQRSVLGSCSAADLYALEPSVPLCFIRQFRCSDNAQIMNQPIIKELQRRQLA